MKNHFGIPHLDEDQLNEIRQLNAVEHAEILLLDYTDITEEGLNCIEGIWGRKMDTLREVLFYETGYRDFDEFISDGSKF